MGILDSKIITGVNPIKSKPTFNGGSFDKKQPIGEHNFPLTKYTKWKIYGYKKRGPLGIKEPYWMYKTLPTGQTLTPQMVGLDGFFDVKAAWQEY